MGARSPRNERPDMKPVIRPWFQKTYKDVFDSLFQIAPLVLKLKTHSRVESAKTEDLESF